MSMSYSRKQTIEEKITFTEIQWIRPYINGKVFLNNNKLLRKIGTDKTQMLHGMESRHFTPR